MKLPKERRWRRAVWITLALPPLLAGLFGLFAAYRIYASNKAQEVRRHYSLYPAPAVPQSLLVFAPHCDDETLGAGGLMRQARLAGCDVHAVIISNGDGFRISVAREFHELTVPAKDFIRYAVNRQQETRNALKVLGVPSDHVIFLGYPDRGLMPMWTTNWSSNNPFRSAFTLADHCPYDNSPTPNAPYSGEALLADIKRQMQADKPTDIFVTHPKDDHPDHAAASVFVRTALEQLRAAGEPWAQTARLHYYLVHRGDWPVPQGLHEDAPLAPPSQMASLDTRWEQFPLCKADIQDKYAAIRRYTSQVHVSARFLYSFDRTNELFGTLTGASPDLFPKVSDRHINLDGSFADWNGVPPFDLDPVGDTVGRAFQGSADISRLFACHDSQNLYVRLDTDRPVSREVNYHILIRPIVRHGAQSEPITLDITPRGKEAVEQAIPGIPNAFYAWNNDMLEASVPLSEVGVISSNPSCTLNIAAETRVANIMVDKTGYRGLSCDIAAPVLAASTPRPTP